MCARMRVCVCVHQCVHVAFVCFFVHVHALPFLLGGTITVNDRVPKHFSGPLFWLGHCNNSTVPVEPKQRIMYVCMQNHNYHIQEKCCINFEIGHCPPWNDSNIRWGFTELKEMLNTHTQQLHCEARGLSLP